MNKIIVIIGIAIAAMVIQPLKGFTQDDTTGKALQALHRMVSAYRQAHHLHFDILYRYAAESNPGEYLDSLVGQYKIHGNRYWSQLSNSETVSDGRLMLTVFTEDSLIYLAAAPSTLNVMTMLDTLLPKQMNAQYHYAVSGTEELVTLSFAGGSAYKEVTWHIDRKTGYLNKMVSVVSADQLYDPAVRSLVTGTANAYVVVETLYNNYRENAFDEQVFDTGRYVRKEGQEYVPVGAYENYQVFVGSPGL